MQRKHGFICGFVVWCVCILCCGCATGRGGAGPDTWGDATLVRGASFELGQLQRDFDSMGESIREISGRIGSLTAGLTSGLERCSSLEDIGAEIDSFVRDLIAENQKLGELYRANR